MEEIQISDVASGTSATIAPARGGMVTGFSALGRAVLFLDRATFDDTSKNVRGGIPLLFPSPGKLEGDAWAREGASGSLKQHGFARNLAWTVVEKKGAALTLALESSDATLAGYPWRFRVEITYRVANGSLAIEARVENRDERPMPFGFGTHGYFAIGTASTFSLASGASRAFDNVTKTEVPADACRQLAREATKAGDPGGGLLALAAIAPASRTPDDAIHEASLHDTLGDTRAAIATLDAIDPSAASEATRALLPLHRALLRTSAGVVERDEAERNAQTVTALRARLPSLGLEDEALSRVERDACLVDAHAAHRLGHLTRAETVLREHLLSSERDALAWALLFDVHAEQGQVEHAAAARKRALELVDPASPLAERLRARSVGPFR